MFFGYQWFRCDSNGFSCKTIPGATGATYVARSSDVRRTLRVVVQASNSAGSASAVSDPTGSVARAGAARTSERQVLLRRAALEALLWL